MLSIQVEKPLLVLVGPTAVGKTELSLRLAERLGGEIISADSRLFYRGMDIGTAKPSREEQERIRHHLIDILEPDEEFSLALYQAKAYETINGVLNRGNLPILVGGTGQYIHAVLYDWKIPAQKPDFALRKSIEDWAIEIGAAALHQKLAYLDPEAAQKIDPNNIRRTIRALEVIFGTGERFSMQRKSSVSRYSTLVIGLIRPRKELYQRVDLRIADMLEKGLLKEIENLLAAGYSPDLPSLSAIGYRELIEHLQGKISQEEAVQLIMRSTRRFIRHQANWFKEKDPKIHWFQASDDPVEKILALAQNQQAWVIAGSPETGAA